MNIKTEKKEAARFLNQKGRRIDLLVFELIMIFASLSPIFIYHYVTYLVSTLIVWSVGDAELSQGVANFLTALSPISGLLLSTLFMIFVTCPIMHRFFLFSYRTHRQGVAGRAEFFGGDGAKYSSSLAKGAVCVATLGICILPIVGSYKVATLLVESENETVAALGVGIFAFLVLTGIFLGFCVFLLFRPLFLFGYFSAKGETVGASFKKSFKVMKTKKAKALYKSYMASFTPSLLLAIPTVFVLFFVDTLPKMITVYYKLCDELVYGDKI